MHASRLRSSKETQNLATNRPTFRASGRVAASDPITKLVSRPGLSPWHVGEEGETLVRIVNECAVGHEIVRPAATQPVSCTYDPQTQGISNVWFTGTAEVNAAHYAHQIKALKSMLHS
jgi:hypothetical protein